GGGGIAKYALDHRPGVPGAKQNTDLAARRQRLPVAPHIGMLALFFGKRTECLGADMAWIHPFIQGIDHFTLAGTLYAANQHYDSGVTAVEQINLGFQQGLTQWRQARLPGLLVDPMT